jgi:hypothetical protein
VSNHPKSEFKRGENGDEVRRFVDQKRGLFDRVFLAQLSKKLFRRTIISSRIEASVEEFVGFGIDGGVQPVSLVTDSNHRLVNRDLIRRVRSGRL